jgi:hypothetical protein
MRKMILPKKTRHFHARPSSRRPSSRISCSAERLNEDGSMLKTRMAQFRCCETILARTLKRNKPFVEDIVNFEPYMDWQASRSYTAHEDFLNMSVFFFFFF